MKSLQTGRVVAKDAISLGSDSESKYQKHNLAGKGAIHDMLASNYPMEHPVPASPSPLKIKKFQSSQSSSS